MSLATHARSGQDFSAGDLWTRAAFATLLLLSLAVVFGRWALPDAREALLRKAETALACEDYTAALRLADAFLADTVLAEEALSHDRRVARALLVAGRAAAKLGRSEQALAYFARVPLEPRDAFAAEACYGAGERVLLEGRLAEAETWLRRALDIHPRHLRAHERLAFALQLEGRTWESLPHLFDGLRRGRFAPDHLMLLGSTESLFIADNAFLQRCVAATPDDPLPLLGQARAAQENNDFVRARPLLERIVARRPDLLEAQGRLGRLLLASDPAALAAWRAKLPPRRDHPEVWLVLGLDAQRRGDLAEAVRCFAATARLHPNHAAAHTRLAQVLVLLGEHEAAAPLAARAAELSKLASLLPDAAESTREAERVATRLAALGRHWEAAGWAEVIRRHEPRHAFARAKLAESSRLLPGRHNLQEDSSRLEALAHVSKRRRAANPTAARRDAPPAASVEPNRVRFEEEAAARGLRFEYFNGADSSAGRAYMFEFSGGGVAALDYDLDGWPDVYCTQGCRWPPRGDSSSASDASKRTDLRNALFRNLGERFAPVPSAGGADDDGFGQGVAVGDVNADGFPDLYVANIGGNRLYINNGDGCFRDATAESGTAGGDLAGGAVADWEWSTSCALADFSGDGLPDLYVVNYLAAPEVFERVCFDRGKPVQCSPTMFEAAPDRLYLNLGDGRFREVTAEAGAAAADGKGLGLLVADFEGSGRLGVFVANDTTPNFLFLPRNEATPRRGTAKPGDPPIAFEECALARGAACDSLGRAQACMGVAADDADGDGRLDLFVTNFHKEANAFYRQTAPGFFEEQSRAAGLYDNSFWLLGWGAQFLDGELDGAPDLLLVNGHINDFREAGTPYQMPPQYLRHRGGGEPRFEEVPAKSLGEYFRGERLGRALARLDWNRDGLEDAIATHVDAPLALLTNRTDQPGRSLTLRLRGRHDRDAIGARVTVVTGQRVRARQLTAGDGYAASNERALVFGLGSAPSADSVRVEWLSGATQTFGACAAGEWLLVEGEGHPFAAPR